MPVVFSWCAKVAQIATVGVAIEAIRVEMVHLAVSSGRVQSAGGATGDFIVDVVSLSTNSVFLMSKKTLFTMIFFTLKMRFWALFDCGTLWHGKTSLAEAEAAKRK